MSFGCMLSFCLGIINDRRFFIIACFIVLMQLVKMARALWSVTKCPGVVARSPLGPLSLYMQVGVLRVAWKLSVFFIGQSSSLIWDHMARHPFFDGFIFLATSANQNRLLIIFLINLS